MPLQGLRCAIYTPHPSGLPEMPLQGNAERRRAIKRGFVRFLTKAFILGVVLGVILAAGAMLIFK